MSYQTRSINFGGILSDIISKTNFLENPKKLLGIIKNDFGATAKIMQKININLRRVIDDFYINRVALPQEEVEEELILEELPKRREIEAEKKAAEEEGEETAILSLEEIEYLQTIFEHSILAIMGLSGKDISMITNALADRESLSRKGVDPRLAERLSILLNSTIVRTANKLSASDEATIKEILLRQEPVKKGERKEIRKKEFNEASKKGKSLEIIDYETFIDIAIDKSTLTKEAILKTIGYNSEIVYEIMTKLLNISPEKIGRDMLGMKMREDIEKYIDDALGQLNEGSYDSILKILNQHNTIIYSLMERVGIGLKEALEALHSENQSGYDAFVDRLFALYGSMFKPDVLQEMVFKDTVIASSIINQCNLKPDELIEIIKGHDEIGFEMERLFKDYDLDYEPFRDIKYMQIENAVEELRATIEKNLRRDEKKVEFLYRIYDIGLNYELEAKNHAYCAIVAQYANKSSANPYEIALRLGDKLEIPLPENFLRDMALSLAMSLKRADLISKERFNELLVKANQYRQEEGYYEITQERKKFI